MANGFIDGIGYPMNGGLAAGLSIAKERQAQERQRGLASGFTQYMNAQDDASKRAARSQIAQNDPNTAFNLMKYEQELANKDKMTPYQAQSLEIQRKQLENQGKMNEYQTWQKEEALRKEQEAKEKEMAFGQAISEFYAAKDDEGRSAALSKAAIIDPKATSDIYKKIKTQEALEKGWTTDRGRMISILSDPNEPQWKKDLVRDLLMAEAQNPLYKGQIAYNSALGKQYAEAGMPYGNVGQVQQEPEQFTFGSTFGTLPTEQAPQTQAMPMQAQPIPTVASLAGDKRRAETRAEGEEKFAKELAQTQANIANYDKLLKDIEDNADLLGPLGYISYKGGELSNGLFGMESEDRKKYAMIYRQVGEMRSRLIARAKAAGQTGINTAKEIELATAGITFTMTAPSLTGAIEELKRNDIMLSEAIARHYGMGEQISQPQEEIIYYEDL